jgi:hypothetical protein
MAVEALPTLLGRGWGESIQHKSVLFFTISFSILKSEEPIPSVVENCSFFKLKVRKDMLTHNFVIGR